MKKRAFWTAATVGALVLGWFIDPMGAASKTAAYLETAQTFTATKTFTGADVQSKFDYTLATPTIAPTAAQLAVTGSCASSQTYRFYQLWCNAGGCSLAGPVSSDYTPPVNNQQVTITKSAESPPANATHWAIGFRRSGDSFANLRACGDTNFSDWYPQSFSASTMTCRCTPGAPLHGSTVPTAGIRETVATSPVGDLRAGQGNPINTQGMLVDDKNILRLTGITPRWSGDSGATFSQVQLLGDAKVVQVCKSGCAYDTVLEGLNAITDASATNRYVVLIGPGTYDVTTNANRMKSYVSLMGSGAPWNTILRQTGSTTNTAVLIPADATELGIFNLTVMGGFAIQTEIAVAYSIRANIYIDNVICGTYDSADNSIDTQACIDEGGSPGGGHIFHVSNTWMRSIGSAVILSQDSDYIDHGGNLYEIDCTRNNSDVSAFKGIGGWSTRIHGGVGSMIWMKDSGTTCLTMIGLPFQSPTSSTARDSYLYWSGQIEMERTNASNGNAMIGVALNSVASAQAGWINLTGVSVNIKSAGGGTLTGLQVDNDADLNDWSIDWTGGSIRTSGSGTRRDVNNDANVSGFEVRLGNVAHGGTYTGAGAARVVPVTARLGSFTSRLDFPAANLVAATCTVGEIKADTAGATQELCWCIAGPAWACVSATTVTGPTD